MAKKNAVPKLSPENYIRQKARTIPVYKCCVNKEWEESKMASVVVARRHVTGNITMAFYLVDMMCLGVKDSFYKFNIPEHEFYEIVDEMNEHLEMEEISYTLAHNIIYGAVSFAGDYGFDPHRTFTSTTIYMLEEDTEDVELIELDLGRDGKPAYMRGPNDSEAKISQIVNTLEKNAGHGNYELILDVLDEDQLYEDDEDEDEDGEEENPYDDMSFEEKKKIYLELSEKKTDEIDDCDNFPALAMSIFDDLYNYADADELYEDYLDKLENYDILSANDPMPDELMGATVDVRINHELEEIYHCINNNIREADKMLQKLKRKLPGDVPFIAFLEVFILFKQEKMKHFSSLREKYLKKYPDYHMLKLLECFEDDWNSQKPYPEDFFRGRSALHPVELFFFMRYLIMSTHNESDPSVIESTTMICEDFFEYFTEDENLALTLAMMLEKIRFVDDYFSGSIAYR